MKDNSPHNKRRARLVLAVAAVAVLSFGLAACGDDDDATEPSSTTAAGSETTTTVSNEPRLVKHAMGETEVPANPQRVVVLDSPFLDAAVALGVTPVATTEAAAGAGPSAYLADELGKISIVG